MNIKNDIELLLLISIMEIWEELGHPEEMTKWLGKKFGYDLSSKRGEISLKLALLDVYKKLIEER